MSADEPQTLEMTLNPNGVAQPANRAVAVATNSVGISLRALENDDLSPPDMRSAQFGYKFPDLEMTADERREDLRNWLLSKGFQDLARGIRETLEEAVFYLEMVKMEAGLTTWDRVQAHMATIRSSAAKPNFPDLLADVNEGLKESMAFEAEFLSLQRVRNCLENRGGRVGKRDVDPISNKMVLKFPRLRLFYLDRDEEVEFLPGDVIDTHNVRTGEGEEIQINLQRVTRAREYSLDESVILSASDFYEIAMACLLFAADVAAKLPTLPPINALKPIEV